MKPVPERRTFLFLQGLACDFFDRLGARLAARGHQVIRVNLNPGDWLLWRQKGALNYRGTRRDWPSYVAELVARRGITDLIVFGDCRPMHRDAIDVSQALRVTIHVVEEGYLRPDYVTVEQDGVNGHSGLPRDPAWYLEAARGLPPVPEIGPLPSSFLRRSVYDVAYNLSNMLFWWLYPFYRTHRPWSAAVEYAGWIWRLLRRGQATRRSASEAARLEDGVPYFLFPLQLDCDSQIRLHSSFSGMRGAIEVVLASFARHAPGGVRLVVKEHPLDNGLVNWRRFVAEAAARLGLTERLVYLEQGDIAPLVARAQGVVTVNSTTGTLALASGIPVVTLGTAIYDLAGLTFQGELDAFWTGATQPDGALFEAFRRVLVNRCLIRGGFFSDAGMAMLLEGAVARLESTAPSRVLVGARAVPKAVPSGLAAVSR